MPIPVKMPQLGESVVEGTIIRWLKQPGEYVEQYEPLLEVTTDKVDTEVTAADSGTLLEILVPAGETATVGTVLAYLGDTEEKPPAEEAPGLQRQEQDVVAPVRGDVESPQHEEIDVSRRDRITPVVSQLMARHNISTDELRSIDGSGLGGRVTKWDLLEYVERRDNRVPNGTPQTSSVPPETSPTAKSAPQAEADGGRVIELSPMRAAIAEHMVRSKRTAPHVTSIFEVDMSRVVAYRQAHRQQFAERGINLTYTAFFVQAAVRALEAYPMANASFTEDNKVVIHPDINVGVAVALEDGLIVPVIERADELNLMGLARTIQDLSVRAREKKLVPDDVRGGTFTVTNPGMQGALLGTAVINQPQAAILGVGAIVERPVAIEGKLAIRPMVYLSLTYDHRIMDGAGANYVLAEMREFLETHQTN